MSIFGFTSRKEVAKKEQEALERGMSQGKTQGINEGIKVGKEAVIREQKTSLSNLAKGSQVKFVIPYFDVFDPRFLDFGVPVSVHGVIVYGVDDLDLFYSLNKTENVDDDVFQQKLKGQVTKFVKGVVSNAPYGTEKEIPVLQIERKIIEISELVQHYVVPEVERIFGINVRSIDIMNINVDKEAPSYHQLRSLTADLAKEEKLTSSSLDLDKMKRQHEMNLSRQEELQRIELENLRLELEDRRESLKKQREGAHELKSLTADLEKEKLLTETSLNIDAMKRQQELNLASQEEMQRMQLEHQRESMRIQREELQRASKLQTETNFLNAHQANLNVGVQTAMAQNGMSQMMTSRTEMPLMTGISGVPAMSEKTPEVQYMVGVNGQQIGPCDWHRLQELVEQGLLTHQTYVWKRGMAQWQFAGEIQELAPLFQGKIPEMPPMPNL